MSRKATSIFVLVMLAIAITGSPAAADHGEGHNGETMVLSNSEGLEDGETLTVELTSFLPGATVTVVTCYRYPAAGPSDCELSNYGMHTASIGNDGSATIEYPVSHVPDRCDASTPCFIVAGDGIGANANYAAVEVTFSGAVASETTEAPSTTAAPTTTAAPATTESPSAADGDDGGTNTGLIIAIIAIAAAVIGGGAYVAKSRKG